jgi:HD-like signal output (HDOD) protein
MMTTSEVQGFEEASLAACRAQFPRSCSSCRVPHPTFLSFLEATRPVGQPKLDPDDDEDDAIGLLSFMNCACGSTLALRYEDVTRHRAFNQAVRHEANRTDRTTTEVVSQHVNAVNERAKCTDAGTAAMGPRPESMLLEVGAAMVATVAAGATLIPPFPAVAFKVAELARDTASTPEQIAKAISSDPTLAAELLQIVNAPIYSRGRPVTSLPVAITRLGMRELARLAIAAGIGRVSAKPGALTAVRQHLWHRSVTTGVVSRLLAAHRGQSAEEAFLAGLLQPLGSIVGTLSLEVFLLRRPTFPSQPLSAWLRILELFRSELGALTAARWQLPKALNDTISFQSGGVTASGAPELIELVMAASQVAHAIADVDEVTEGTLHDVAGLKAGESSLLVRELPKLAEAIASFEDAPSPLAGHSRIVPVEFAPMPRLNRDVYVVNCRRPDERFRVASASPRVLVLEGSNELPENLVVGLQVTAEPPLPFFATVRSSRRDGRMVQLVISPFALDRDTGRYLRQAFKNR